MSYNSGMILAKIVTMYYSQNYAGIKLRPMHATMCIIWYNKEVALSMWLASYTASYL